MNPNFASARDEMVSSLKGLEPVWRAHGIRELAVFGSRARGDHRPQSDIDILVEVEPGIKFPRLDLVGISHIITDGLHIPANMFKKRRGEAGPHRRFAATRRRKLDGARVHRRKKAVTLRIATRAAVFKQLVIDCIERRPSTADTRRKAAE